MNDLLSPPTRAEILGEIARELRIRREFYPRRVAEGKMKPEAAETQIRRLQAGYDFIMHKMPEDPR